ncbi:MAG: MlaD family protein [Acetobacteraceae bacterium]|nr:MlaD family protein [Acetobacteraceae bacterium]
MTEGHGAFLRVGLLIVAGAALLAGLVWFLGGARINKGSLYESYFRESVQGLEVGAPVKYRGVTVGRVSEIGLVTADYDTGTSVQLNRQIYRMVLVRYLVDRARFGRLPETSEAVALGLRARLASAGLTGVTYIEMDFVDATRYPFDPVPWTPRAGYIPSMPSTLTQVQDAAQQLLAKLDQVDIVRLSNTMIGVLDDLRATMATGDVHQMLDRAQVLLQTTEESVKAADLAGLTKDMRQTSAAIRDVAQSRDLQRTLAGAAQAADRLAATTAQLPALIASLQATSRRADNGAADLQQGLAPLLRDMQATAANLRELTEALRRNPAQVLVSQPPPRAPEAVR